MKLTMNDCTVYTSSNSASKDGRFLLSGRVLALNEPAFSAVHFNLTLFKGKPDYCINLPSAVNNGFGNGAAMALIQAVKVVEQLINRYTDYLKLAIEEKGEFGRIISAIETKEYELAALFIDMVEIGDKYLTESARIDLELNGPHGCESVLDVILRSDAFKPAITLYRDRWQSEIYEPIDEELKPLFILASSVHNAHSMLAYIELMKLDTDKENTFTNVHDWKANRLTVLDPKIVSRAIARSTEKFLSFV